MLKWPGPEVRVRASTYWLAVIAALLVAAVLFGDGDRDVIEFVNKWQTLIAGLLAIVAAWISLSGPREQIRQAERLADATREREELAARALMPGALNMIVDYINACSRSIEHKFAFDGNVANPIALPSFDRTSLSVVSACIRYAPILQRTRMAALLSNFQIFEANAVSSVPVYPSHALFVRIANCQYLCDTLWNYSRGQFEAFPADAPLEAPPDYIRQVQFFSPVHDGFWPDLEPYLRRVEERAAQQDAPFPPPASPPAPN